VDENTRIVITGAAGLLGQNTILMLRERGYRDIVAIDKHRGNLEILRRLNPGVRVVEADLAEPGPWEDELEGCGALLQLHAQITSTELADFTRNNEQATSLVLQAAGKHRVPHIVHISSSVVVSVADDFYTNTKKAQERQVDASGIPHCVLRPTLMFGWFDKKHLGWLSRFMAKTPVFPIPGSGKYLRQPLYVRDMAAVVIAAMRQRAEGSFNIIGREEIDYIDIIKAIRDVQKSRTLVVRIPYGLFKFLMDAYAAILGNPPFTSQQLAALTAGDYFTSDPWWDIFAVTPTPFREALRQTFGDGEYSAIVLQP
jgi:nucleoside-diphosphate-sugar epimerase